MSTDAVSQEVAQTQQYVQIARLMTRLGNEAEEAANDPQAQQDIIFSIMENILAAETPEELFERQEAGGIASKDYINKPFLIHEVVWKKSTLSTATTFPYYAQVTITDLESGNKQSVNGGGFSFVSVLSKLDEFNLFGEAHTYQLVEKPTGSGNNVILIKPVATGKPRTGSAKRAADAKH